MASFPGQPG